MIKGKNLKAWLVTGVASTLFSIGSVNASTLVYEPGHDSLKEWLLPEKPPVPAENEPNEDRVELGKMLFFEPRLSKDGNMSCATCHNPSLGWSDGLPTAKGFQSKVLGRATPTIFNTVYNSIQMWDGRKKDLIDQASGPMEAGVEMNSNIPHVLEWLNITEVYKDAFAKAYPGEPINMDTVSKAIAAFEYTVVSRNSPFDRWVNGEHSALTQSQINGFKVFTDPNKGACANCHMGGNFTDNGFHNVGLVRPDDKDADVGRYKQRPLKSMYGAFKTPTVREVARTAPYFHDGSAMTLMEVVEHYEKLEEGKGGVSVNVKSISLTKKEKEDLVAFMEALSSPPTPLEVPILP